MVPPRHFRFPLSAWQQATRRLYCTALRRLGIAPHVMRAQGARFVVDTDDYVDRFIAFEGMWEGDQLERLAALASERPIDLFVDAGANTGFYSVMFAIRQLAQRVIAFEPDPGNHARLMANLRANDLVGRIETVSVALGDQSSEVTLYEGAPWNRGESTIAVPEQTPQEFSHRVQQVRFDDLYRFDSANIIVKMDVEGYEFHALAGMERTLRDNACYLQVELYSERIDELAAWFAARDYRFLLTHGIDHYFTNMPGIEVAPARATTPLAVAYSLLK
jgi:FkbM family methyltransferase